MRSTSTRPRETPGITERGALRERLGLSCWFENKACKRAHASSRAGPEEIAKRNRPFWALISVTANDFVAVRAHERIAGCARP
jgi:hypothetical protein